MTGVVVPPDDVIAVAAVALAVFLTCLCRSRCPVVATAEATDRKKPEWVEPTSEGTMLGTCPACLRTCWAHSLCNHGYRPPSPKPADPPKDEAATTEDPKKKPYKPN